MIEIINFSQIDNKELLRQEIKPFFADDNYLSINKEAVKKRGWSYAQMEKDVRQLFDEDAQNLSGALHRLGCTHVYGTHFDNIHKANDFSVIKFSIDSAIIELVQTSSFEYLIDLDDSFIFSDYPLKFLILRPAYTISAYMYILGEAEFVGEACAEYGWTIAHNDK
ncbi:hypothetical protein A1019T_01848 [Psychrobacter pasteurii]|uniref:Uncharacterized protein n=1 Tax=Psychrobacter pasteurii TaxID=1945520 RepID=A0A1R4EHE1_9GAMM|nr:hypothetical protein [Psychrobacter pasteurii]SJM37863.1 hypothetical protein A1019T_01848 [Psychrobacter pasteurii]